MLVYVYETNLIYQYSIDNYDALWSGATGATGVGGNTVVQTILVRLLKTIQLKVKLLLILGQVLQLKDIIVTGQMQDGEFSVVL